MAEHLGNAHANLLRVRKERVHATMLVEVLALLIFLAMTFAFVLRDEAVRTPSYWKRQYEQVLKQVGDLKRENALLRTQVAELEQFNRQLLRKVYGTLPSNDTVTLTRDQWRELVNRSANAEQIVASQQREIAQLRERLAGRGGSDLPNCTVSPSTFIVRIELLSGGYRAQALWPAESAQAVAAVPGLRELASGRVLSHAEFRNLGEQIRAWSRGQAVPCNFRARAVLRHGSLPLYRTQQAAVGGIFYASYQ